MSVERDKFLTKAMGECWHDYSYPNNCVKCNKQIQDLYFIDFSTWSGFGKLWEWAQKQEWWKPFVYKVNSIDDVYHISNSIIDPDRFADTIYSYLKEKS